MASPSKSPTGENLEKIGLVESHGIDIDAPAANPPPERPMAVSHLSSPTYQSPLRHHRRQSSRNRAVKETLNAKSQYGSGSDEGPSIHKINQYILKQEIGRGSFGCVLLAEDQFGNEFAIKEFSKSRLRKRAQSNLLRRPAARKNRFGLITSDTNIGHPLHGQKSPASRSGTDTNNAFDLIKGEIAVMKKLNHPNVVSLIEVLDDPDEDSLYMVLEMCKKGVVMKVGLDETADPYDEETCRYWFRDLVLGLEYLHHQGIIHRDLKPDNCLITHDDVLKIVDFGVSEMFDNKTSDMSTAKSAGSPAFMPPELCVAKHGNVSGRAIDIWSMGVTLYCLRYGKIPFESSNMLDLYEAIRNNDLDLNAEKIEDFRDLMFRLLEKDPSKRITMQEIRVHPWVTKRGADPLLSEDENCNHIVDEPTEAEMDAAITGNMGRLLAVAKAVKSFKKLLNRKRPEILDGFLGHPSRFVAPPASMDCNRIRRKSRSQDTFDRRPVETVLAVEGVHHKLHVGESDIVTPEAQESPVPLPSVERIQKRLVQSPESEPTSSTATSSSHTPTRHRGSRNFSPDDSGRGHAHDPLRDTLFLNIGAGADTAAGADLTATVCESPGGVDESIFEKAYEEELERIIDREGKSATMYLTRRVEHKDELRQREGVVDHKRAATAGGGLAAVVRRAKAQVQAHENEDEKHVNASDETKAGD
ncbi:Pkinase-domain-containing protein [Myriangium duriaei CBS 260.36]|uniref:Pkinase-domain-containing protein n=1 Tax=Myriangium duriaei CBS 260.36 TaxID=1168546 RepID=A0A9P4J617_9PEZI|nr:Pkinase-domain-containing protein [Myriangium duriaei CBS 260.36]